MLAKHTPQSSATSGLLSKARLPALLGVEPLELRTFVEVARGFERADVALNEQARQRMVTCNQYFARSLDTRVPIYGLNTQFGDQVTLLDKHLDDYETDNYRASITARQYDLVRSHNCGVGEVAPAEVVRGAMLLRAQCLSRGFSGVRPEVVESYLTLLRNDIVPLCRRYGSIGASGDLVPLATIAAVAVGEDVPARYQGGVVPAREALARAGLQPLRLEGRDGLALINGTSFMTSIAGLALYDLLRLFDQMIHTTAIAAEALLTIREGYDPLVHELKGHAGQLTVARRMQGLWEGSQLVRGLSTARTHGAQQLGVQDYYSLRSIAHGFGVFQENLERAKQWIESEMFSVNDNPIVSHDSDVILHTANFMGYYVSSACDMLRADIAQAATWLHAVMANLVHPRKNRGLPTNLTKQPETYSGFRPLQILAASLAVQCRKLAQVHASYVLPTEGDNQDVNSLGTHAAFDLRAATEQLEQLVAVLLMAGCQALELRGVELASQASREVFDAYRRKVPFLAADRVVHDDLMATVRFLRENPSMRESV
jgi:histidine ammonia-lyase